MRRALREAEVRCMLLLMLLLLLELLMLASCAQALKLSDFVPATEETQIACQQARKSSCLSFCVYFSIDMCKFQREAAAAIGLRLQVILYSLRVQLPRAMFDLEFSTVAFAECST
jgi:hypothetical protein